jgi:hypothetical protein
MSENKAADPKAPHAVATTTPPSGTFHELKVAEGDGVLMYWPEQNAFLALFPEEYRDFYAQADEHSRKIGALQAANRKVTEASIALREAQKRGVAAEIKKADAALEAGLNEMQQASAEVKKKLEPLSNMDAKDGVKMVELVSLRTPKYKEKAVPIYVTSTKLKKILAENRVHLVTNEKSKRVQEKLLKNGKLDVKEIKKRIEEKVQDQGFKKKWKLAPDDADAYTGVLTEWARTMNGDIATFLERAKDDVEKKFNIDPKDSRRNIDLSADAQLMRYTAGAGLEVNFKPFRGNLHDGRDANWYQRVKRGAKSGELAIKANAQTSFAIAEGRVRAEVYLPHCAGFHASTAIGGESFDLGYWRFYGDIVLSGSAGASLAVEVDIGVTYTGGKQGIRGIPRSQKKKGAVKVGAGAGAELDIFAGARAGVDVTGALQWLNPEGAKSNGKPLKTKPDDAVAEYKDIAQIASGAAATAGIGVKGALKVKHEEGKFVIYAKLGACIGVGGDGTLKYEASFETIGEFFKCLAYQLKRADFHKIRDSIEADAYGAYCQVKYLVIANGRVLEEYVEKELTSIDKEFNRTKKVIDDAIRAGSAEAETFLKRVRNELERRAGGWLSYAAPEVMGQILNQIVAARQSKNPLLSEQAPEVIKLALEAPQSINHLYTIAERMTPVMGDKQEAATGMALLTACVAGTPYGHSLEQVERRLAQAQTLISKPFMWNSEPEFVAAKLGIEHPMYA